MSLKRWRSRVLACTVVCAAPLAMGAIDIRTSIDERILVAQNQERVALGLEPLSWNPALARSAQRWADYLAATGRFEHAPENRRAPEGENLWAGTKGYFAPEAMVGAWIREKQFFRPGVFPNNSITGRVEDVGQLYPAGLARDLASGLRAVGERARGHPGLPLCRSRQLSGRASVLGIRRAARGKPGASKNKPRQRGPEGVKR